MPTAELAGPARERVSRAVHRAAERGENQLAAVLLLAQSDGYQAVGDIAGALHLVQEGLTLNDIEPRTRERLLDSGVELASCDPAAATTHYHQALDIRRHLADQHDTPQALSDLASSFGNLGDASRDLGDLTTSRAYRLKALDIRRGLADQLGTAPALRDLRASLTDLAQIEDELGTAAQAGELRAEAATVSDQLAALSDHPLDHPRSHS